MTFRTLAAAACLSICTATAGLAATLSTGFIAGNDANGNMFDIDVGANDITLKDLEVHLGSVSTTLDVWYKSGSYVGSASDASAWTKLDSVNVTGAGPNTATSVGITDQVFAANTTYSLFLYSDVATMYYRNGIGSPTADAASNGDVTINVGLGRASNADPFAGLAFDNRIWEGTLIYDVNVAAVPLPAGGLLLLSAFGGVAALKRRKKRAA